MPGKRLPDIGYLRRIFALVNWVSEKAIQQLCQEFRTVRESQ